MGWSASTPAALFAELLAGVTEVPACTYVFHELVMVGLNVCGFVDIALRILTSVIGHQFEKGWVLADSGWTVMSRDCRTWGKPMVQGSGKRCDEAGKPGQGRLVATANQERGIACHRDATPAGGDVVTRFRVGTRLRVLSDHACATAARHGHCVVRCAAAR